MKDSETSSDKLTIEQIEEMDDRWLDQLTEEINAGVRKIYQDLQDKIPEIVDLKIKDEWVSVTEAARIIGVDKGTVSRWANERLIADNVETGRNRRIRLTSVLLLKYMREQNARQKDVDDILQDIEKENPQYALKSL